MIVGCSGGSSGNSTNEELQSKLATAEAKIAALEGTPVSQTPEAAGADVPATEAPVTNRLNCDEIRGTKFLSDAERQWFLANCGPSPTPTVINRLNCDEIRGTQYLSDAERQWFLANCGPPPTPTVRPTPAPTSATRGSAGQVLALISSNCTVDSIGYVTCEGFVRNISGKTISDAIEVDIIWYDSGGTPQSSTTGYVKYNPLLAGQESPWTTFDSANPLLTKYRVQFSTFLGGTLSVRDDRKQ